jgi:carotenoid cleavage dioxygenase-like enzyme
MSATSNVQTAPDYLSGFMGPVPDEIEAFDLKVEGALPPELDGLYVRNGANPLPGTDPGHSFTGHGMVHGVRLSGGHAAWYRNKWVQTPALHGARPVRADGTRDLTASTANTSVLGYDGKIFALVENCLPFALTDNLDTVGPYDFGGALKGPMTAHPKLDPVTGRLHFFGYDFRPPFLQYHVATADGRILRSVPISVTGPTMMHDFAVTEHYIAWLDMPVVFDLSRIGKPGMAYRWSDDYPTRIGVMPHDGSDADVHWFVVQPGYAFHVCNAHEDTQGRIVLEAVNYDRTSFNSLWKELGGYSVLSDSDKTKKPVGGAFYRWTLDPATGQVSEAALDDLAVEFPTISAAKAGRPNRFTYAVNTPLLTERDGARIVKYDTQTGARAEHDLGRDWVPGEAIFVPAQQGSAEDHGWLVSIVTHANADRANLLVQDASDPQLKQVAAVALPRRVPGGFHGAWIDRSH